MSAEHWAQSPVPDLIYEDYRAARVAEVAAHLRERAGELPEHWRRITLFTTYRCNLNCIYCKTIRRNPRRPYPAKDREYDFPLFVRRLAALSARPVRHIHFTGGEATLVPDLPRMVETASKEGILCSMTSNGMADRGVYERLMAAGLSEIRISLDSHDARQFDRLVNRAGAYKRVVETISHLVHLRDQHGSRPFVIVNMCIGTRNRRRLSEFVKKTLALGPNDVKLITMVQARDKLANFDERDEITTEIDDLLSTLSPGEFPLLRYKLKTVFAAQGLGLKDLASTQLMRNCFIPLAERTMDTTYYYPCSVYLREGGKPFGKLEDDSLELQQRKIADFVSTSKCLDDPICREYCINCCKKFNLFTNARVHGTLRGMDGADVPIVKTIVVHDHIALRDVENSARQADRDLRMCRPDAPLVPFLVIKPSGVAHKDEIYAALRKAKLDVQEEMIIPDWNMAAVGLYAKSVSRERVLRGLLLARALPEVEGQSSAILLTLKGDVDMSVLKGIKQRLRKRFPPEYCLVQQRDNIEVTALNFIHVPDPEECGREYALLMRDYIKR